MMLRKIFERVDLRSRNSLLMSLVYKFIFIPSFLIILAGGKGFAQANDMATQEDRFAKLYANLLTHVPADYDSINVYSDKFSVAFANFIKNNTATLYYPFQKLVDSNYCEVRTSRDGNFRMYSWDTWKGGSMHVFKEIYQWKGSGTVFTKIPARSEGDPGNFCSKIFTVDINAKTYYLAVTNGIYSNKDASQSISVYTIDRNKLIDTVRLFKTKTKRLNRIDVSFDFFSVADRPERPLELITYDEKQAILYVPVVDGKGRVTARNILYQLKSRYFEFVGTATAKRK